jgi:hypothetical protein
MADLKKSFIVHIDSLDVLEELTIEQAGQLLHAFRAYNLGKEVELNGLLKAVFIPFKNQFDRDLEKYNSIVLRNRENGSKGGKPKQTQTNPVGILGTQDNPNKPDNDNDSDNDSDSDNESENVISNNIIKTNFSEKFQKPNHSEISQFILQKYPDGDFQGSINFAEKFFDFYENKDWKIGKAKMKNWKLAISSWSETLQKDLFPTLQNQLKTNQQDFQDSKVGKLMQVSQEADELIRQMFKDKKENESANSN